MKLVHRQYEPVSSAAILPHETQVGWCHGRRKLAEEVHDSLQVASTFDEQAKGCRLATDSLSRQTLFRASRISGRDLDSHIPEPRRLRRARNGLCQGQPLVPDDTQSLNLHPGPAPQE